MRAAVVQAGGRVVPIELPRPTVGAGELLLRVRGCGLCGSDIAKIAAPPTRGPAVLGHEVVGDVVEAGPGGAGFDVGDRVVVAHHVPCGECHYCQRGSESMCRAFKASHLDPGGFAEYVRVPPANVRHATFRIPDHLTDEEASFVEPLACCVRAVDRARLEPGDTAVVVGLGSIGCLLVQLTRRAGAIVVGADPLSDRAALARDLGAQVAGDAATAAAATPELSDGRGADHVIITGGGAEVLPWAASLVREGGEQVPEDRIRRRAADTLLDLDRAVGAELDVLLEDLEALDLGGGPVRHHGRDLDDGLRRRLAAHDEERRDRDHPQSSHCRALHLFASLACSRSPPLPSRNGRAVIELIRTYRQVAQPVNCGAGARADPTKIRCPVETRAFRLWRGQVGTCKLQVVSLTSSCLRPAPQPRVFPLL